MTDDDDAAAPRTILYQFPAMLGLPNASPPCMKVETYLRFRKLPYRTEIRSTRQSPSGQLPFATMPDGRVLADSERIIDALEAEWEAAGKGPALDAGLSDAERGLSTLLCTTFERDLYWQIVWSRWGEDATWRAFFGEMRTHLPWLLANGPVMPMARRKVVKRLKVEGLSREKRAAIPVKAQAILDTLAQILGDKPFFLGDAPRRIDMTAYAGLSSAMDQTLDTPLTRAANAMPTLLAYQRRMKALTFGG
ncbi:glutathione S-transferase family protein [Phaeovulum vinaykumarii]|uniref:Glutathione S-transferase-like protein n=1 Tax=Phaeovulum vinaykumarii TaxID=407234 RepID=A0A1N7MFA5_9RHOB|nr:glutathione S-transferase family protein [Phaeovulum vinaykumarii]SIS84783.1 glutathione S-transferase-like protein [Phaeovulum vinaykumarii]SOC11940.1 glutathione S-transferase-like protein [Phaeovulum vinaykumarii]